MHLFVDRKFRLPRIWSNQELRKFAHLFEGDVVNVSGWKDIDKEGRKYQQYFTSASSYKITNYESEARGFQGYKDEIFLDLEKDLPTDLKKRFDVVFNHTVLEHIYKVHKAFENLCLMSKDTIILVVPFLQEMHTSYGDYWRFTPLALKNMFEENEFKIQYLSFNSHRNASVYLFCIATRFPEKWETKIPYHFTIEDNKKLNDGFDNYVGCHAIQNIRYSLTRKIKNFLKVK